MKRVFSRGSEVIHLFANLDAVERVFRYDRNQSGNVFFNAGKLYSYGHHFELARWVETASGWVLLLTTAGSTVTTEKHKRELRSASSHIANRVQLPESDSID